MTAYQTGQRFGAVLVFYVHTPRRTRYKADLSEKRVHIFGSRNAILGGVDIWGDKISATG